MELGKLPISLDSPSSHPYKTVRAHEKTTQFSCMNTDLKKKNSKIIYIMK